MEPESDGVISSYNEAEGAGLITVRGCSEAVIFSLSGLNRNVVGKKIRDLVLDKSGERATSFKFVQ